MQSVGMLVESSDDPAEMKNSTLADLDLLILS